MRTLLQRGLVGALAMTMAVAVLAVASGSASADPFGQITTWGSPGTGAGQFNAPTEFGVDPTDNSVYVVDMSSDYLSYRLQKFSSTGQSLATVSIPRPIVNSRIMVLMGAVVDPALHRLYLLQFHDRADVDTGLPAAEQILVFSTQESGGMLQQLPSIPVPDPTISGTGGANALDNPHGLALDPTTHDLVVMAYDRSGNLVLQRIGSDGTLGSRFTDSAGSVLSTGTGGYNTFTGLAIGPDGTMYLSNGTSQNIINIYRLSSDFKTLTAVVPPTPAGESWNPDGAITPSTTFGGGLGPQLAISPDGSTLFWSEQIAAASSSTPGSYTVRGFSLAKGATSVLYGGGTSGTCQITYFGAAIAAGSSGDIYVLDHGVVQPHVTSPFGADVTEFGPGGSGCPAPNASFTVNGNTADPVTVQKGSTVTFDASGSTLQGGTPTELDWDPDGSGTFADVVTGSPAAMTDTHKYLTKGDFTVSLRMKVSGSALGNPPVVTKTIHVVPGTPTAAFRASTNSPAAGASVTFDASASVDPTGSPTATPTSTLKTYSWSFGDGSTQTTTTPTVSHAFANAGAAAVNRTVTLKVTSFDGVDSAPVSQQLSVQGTPVSNPPPPPPPPPPAPPITSPISPPLAVAAAGRASLLATALKSSGSATLTVGCASSACNGTVTLVAMIPGKGKHGAKGRAKATVVGSAGFSLAAGGRRILTVGLSEAARALLAKSHRLQVTVRIVTHNSAGAQASTSNATTLVLPAKKKKGRR